MEVRAETTSLLQEGQSNSEGERELQAKGRKRESDERSNKVTQNVESGRRRKTQKRETIVLEDVRNPTVTLIKTCSQSLSLKILKNTWSY